MGHARHFLGEFYLLKNLVLLDDLEHFIDGEHEAEASEHGRANRDHDYP